MKKGLILFLMTVAACSLNNAFPDSQIEDIDKLINIIKKNSEDYIRISEKKLAALDAALAVEKQIDVYFRDLNQTIELRVHSKMDGLSDDMKYHQDLIDQKVYLENALVGVGIIVPKIEASSRKVEAILGECCGDVQEIKRKKNDKILGNLSRLETKLKTRKEEIEQNLKAWDAWQMKVAQEAKDRYQYEVMSHLEVIQSLDKISGTLSVLNTNFYLALKSHDYVDAENILQGYAWVRATFPIFFSDKITNESQFQLLSQIKDEAEFEQREMTNFLKAHPQKIQD